MAVEMTIPASVVASRAVPMSVDARTAVRMRAAQTPISGPVKGIRMPFIGFRAESADVGPVPSTCVVTVAHTVSTDVPSTTNYVPSTTKQQATTGDLIGATPGRTWRPPD